MELLDLFKNKRSCKKFLSKSVEQSKIDMIIEAGLYASSGKNQQDSIVIQITNKKIIDELEKLNASIMGVNNAKPFYNAPVILLVASKKVFTSTYDGSLMVGNMLNEAYSLGLGSCWIHRAKEELLSPFCKELFNKIGLDVNDYEGIANVVIGYPDPNYKTEKKIIKENRVFKIN